MQRLNNATIKKQAIELLKKSDKRCSINYVAQHLNIAWATARVILLKLVIDGKVKSEETTTGLLFWVDNHSEIQ